MRPATGTGPLLDTTNCHICCHCCCCCCCCCIEYYTCCHTSLCYETTIHPCYQPEPSCDAHQQRQQQQQHHHHSHQEQQHPLERGGQCSLCSGIDEHHSVLSTTDDTESLETTSKDRRHDADNDEESYIPIQRKQALKRQHAVDELLQTERDYVDDLAYLVEVYFETLSRQDWISPEHKATIIRNAVDLLAFHREFIEALYADNIDENHIANVFLNKGHGFMLYNGYCDAHSEAWRLCEEYRERPEWATFLKECIATSISNTPGSSTIGSALIDSPLHAPTSNSKRLQFEDYLIKPVQRICRYPLLLKEILRHTSPDAASNEMLSEALDLMQDVVKEIDRRKNESEMQDKTQRFLQRLDGDWRWNTRHTEKLGQLLLGGALEVTYTAVGQSIAKPRYLGCFVFLRYMILVRPKKVSVYEPKHWFPLRLAELEDIPDAGEGQRETNFIVRCKKHAFAFSASCPQEKQIWIKAIRQAIDNANTEPDETQQQLEEIIATSLPGLLQSSRQSVRLSRSFTSVLDVRVSGSSSENAAQKRATLRRSLSTGIQLEDHHRKPNEQDTPTAAASTFSGSTPFKKRNTLDYPSATARKEAMKSRTASDSFIKTLKNDCDNAAALTRKRPGSFELLTSTSTNVIGKMSFQLRNNHQNALRMAVDHKLHDVCTQDYLSSKAWYLREKEINSASSVDLRKRKSAPFIRSSASSFSMISPRRVSNGSVLSRHLHSPETDLQSTASSASSIDDTSVMKPGRRFSSSWRPNTRRTNSRQYTRQVSETTTNIASLNHKADDELDYLDIPSAAAAAAAHPDITFTHTKAVDDYDDNGQTSVPLSVFSGMERASSYSINMQPLRHGVKSMLVGKMFNKLSPFNKRSQKRQATTAFDTSSRCIFTPEDYESDVNSFNASEVECSRQGTLSNPSLQLRDMQDEYQNDRKRPLFQWVRSDNGVIGQTTTTATTVVGQNSQQPPLAFAYASTPAAEPQKSRWKRRFTPKPQVRPP